MKTHFAILFLFSFLSLFPKAKCQTYTMQHYDSIKEKSINDRFLKHDQLLTLIEPLTSDKRFVVKKIGASIEGRDIYKIQIGKGDTKILMWSQMHGDEPTATMAIMDLLKYFRNRDIDENFKKRLLEDLSIHIIPMLNPDGAEQYQRRNAVGIDLNRDALRLQCPESQILKSQVDALQPDWGFNLHDQSRYYSAGRSNKSATFSFLAPAFNYQKEVNDVRKRAMQLIVSLHRYIINHSDLGVGRYDDAFEPRAFGDNITKWGVSTILVECGGLKGDLEKQKIRKWHFGLFLHAFDCIRSGCYKENKQAEYEQIEENQRSLHDVLLQNLTVSQNGHQIVLDIAFKKATQAPYKARISDIGDLSVSHAYSSYDLKGYEVVPFEDLRSNKFNPVTQALFHLHRQEDHQLSLYTNPIFGLQKKGVLEYLVINGNLVRL